MVELAWVILAGILVAGAVSARAKQPQVSDLMLGFVTVTLIAFAGLRRIGADQDSNAYAAYYRLPDTALNDVVEPSFTWIRATTSAVSQVDGFRYLLVTYAVIGVGLKIAAIVKLSPLRWLSIATYFTSYFLLHEFTQIRVAVASSLILFSLKAVYEQNLRRFLLLVAMASMFHYSALLAIPLYLLRGQNLSRRSSAAILASIPVALILRELQFNPLYVVPIDTVRAKVEVYLATEEQRDLKLNIFNKVYLVKYLILYVLMFLGPRIEAKWKYFGVYIKTYAVSLFAYIALSYNSVFAIRVSELFGVVEISTLR